MADFGRPTVAIVKHTNPCGLASADGLPEAFAGALAGDPVSAFGSVIAVNGIVELALVEAIGRLFVEVLVAPAFAPDAVAALRAKKPACRLIAASTAVDRSTAARSIFAGVLAQDADVVPVDVDGWRVVTRRSPSEAEREALAFAWRAVKHVKSKRLGTAKVERRLSGASETVQWWGWRAGLGGEKCVRDETNGDLRAEGGESGGVARGEAGVSGPAGTPLRPPVSGVGSAGGRASRCGA